VYRSRPPSAVLVEHTRHGLCAPFAVFGGRAPSSL
jgi:hypothetical protein